MKVFVIMMMVGVGMTVLPPPQDSYKILMLLPISTRSHRTMFMTLAQSLADRGHKVVMLTNHAPSSMTHPNITEIHHGLAHYDPQKLNMFNKLEMMTFNKMVLSNTARDLYNVPRVKELYKRRKEFDVVMVNSVQNELAYPFTHELPFIGVASMDAPTELNAMMGNILNPAYVPDVYSNSFTSNTLWHRLLNFITIIKRTFYWRVWTVIPSIQKQISVHFPDLPPLIDLERNQSLILSNTHFSLSIPKPMLPSQIEVGAMHCRPSKPLPQNLEKWVSEAGSEGVVYFSLGSLCLGTSMPIKYLNIFREAFRRIPHRVLWKYEDKIKAIPDNVMLSKWLPQQDVLGHRNVKVFISHGGLFSLQESVYHKTPLLILPIFADQDKNAIMVNNLGMGKMLKWEELTADDVVDAIKELISNPKYHKHVSKVSELLRDQMTTAKDRAVFWTEYVIRHGGVPELKCPASHLSWPQFLMLDVLFILFTAMLIFCYVSFRVTRALWTTIVVFYGYGRPTHEKLD